MAGGGGESTTSSAPQYTPEQQQMQSQLLNYVTQTSDATGGPSLGSYDKLYAAYNPSQATHQYANETIGALENQFTGAAEGMSPWMNTTQEAINNTPLTNQDLVQSWTPTATDYTTPNTQAYMGAAQGYVPSIGGVEAMSYAPAYYNPYTSQQAASQAMGYQTPYSPQQAAAMAAQQQNFMPGMPTASGGSVNQQSMAELQSSMGGIALDADAANQAAQDYMTMIAGPTIEQNAVASGSGAMSGATLEAQMNAAAMMAVPITQSVMTNQAAMMTPQVQAQMNTQLQQQGAQQGMQAQGYSGNIQSGLTQQQAQDAMTMQNMGATYQGSLAEQQAQNQLVSQNLGATYQGSLAQQQAQSQLLQQNLGAYYSGGLAQQEAQNQILSQGFGGEVSGSLASQQAQNQYLSAQQQAGLTGLQQQGQNMYNYQMSIPQQQSIMLGNIANAGQTQMSLANLDQQTQQQILAIQTQQWNQALAAAAGTAYTNPGSTTTSSSGSSGGSLAGAAGGAATGAMAGSVVPGWGTAAGAVIGGTIGYFCWIADALYGEDSEDANAARAWVGEGWIGGLADLFRTWYYTHGMEVAHALKNDPEFRDAYEADYRKLFDEFVEKGKAYLANDGSNDSPSGGHADHARGGST